ncbi:MAG: hypothetical protein V4616_10375, partial [Bacteroidota bacterium]
NIADPTDAHSAVSTASFGVYVFRWTEINGNCPPSTDDVEIGFYENPVGNAGPDQNICGLTTSLDAVAIIGTGIW